MWRIAQSNRSNQASYHNGSHSSISANQFAPTGALKNFLLADSTCALAPWITEEDKIYHHAAFGNDYTPSLYRYHRGINSLGVQEEKELLKLGVMKNKLGKETLMATGLRDAVSSSKRSRLAMEKSVEKGLLKVVDVDAGHWITLERAQETNQILEDLFESGVDGKETKALL
jgi:soluble epoxide hydrolase/lipid-phosphate phosphatase